VDFQRKFCITKIVKNLNYRFSKNLNKTAFVKETAFAWEINKF